jgi:hypothetical protein
VNLVPWAPGLLSIALGLIPGGTAAYQQFRLQGAVRQALAGSVEAQRRALELAPQVSKRSSFFAAAGWLTIMLGLAYLMAMGLMGKLT